MTERVLPTIGTGARPRPAARTGPGSMAAARPAATGRAVVARRDEILTPPARAGMLLGASAAVYAVTLAGIAGVQSQADAAVAAAREPYGAVIAGSRAANDALEARIRATSAAVTGLLGDYDALGTGVAAYEARLDELAALVSEVRGSAAALPARIRLPTVSARGPIAGSGGGGGGPAPRTSGRSGGSGG